MASHSPSKMAKSLLLLCGIQAGFAFTHGPSPVAGLAGKRVRAAASSRMPFRRIPLLRMQEMGGGGLEEPSPLRRMEVDGPVGGAKPERYTLYPERWTQLAILSILALLSDWACFATAGGPQTWISQFNHNPEDLIDLFLFTNVVTCFFFTDITRKYGIRKVVTGAAGLMAVGCLFRSGMPSDLFLPDYLSEIIGTIFIGASQPFFQCSPPLLSGTWFGQDERALSTSICLNANQLGIATAFLVGGFFLGGKGVGTALDEYLTIITFCSVAAFGATLALFRDRPPTPPTASAAKHMRDHNLDAVEHQGPFLTFPKTVKTLLATKGFLAPLAAFVCSIGVTNVISAFTSETMQRAGFSSDILIDEIGAGFQIAIMAGGIVLGGYVDKTKRYKEVTLACFGGAFATLALLGVAEGYKVTLPPAVVIGSLVGLGALIGPVQPITAELAVEVSYPEDECAVEATQQLAGNLFSALLVPLCVKAMATDWSFAIPLMDRVQKADIRGDTMVLLGLVGLTTLFFTTFDGELKREAADQEGDPTHKTHIVDEALKNQSLHLGDAAATEKAKEEALIGDE